MKPRYPTEEPVRQLAVFVSKQPRQVYGKASQLRLRRPRKPPVRVSDDLVHSIRQRAYELNIRLGELGDATSSGTYFRSPTKRRNYLAIVRALAVLGGEVRLG